MRPVLRSGRAAHRILVLAPVFAPILALILASALALGCGEPRSAPETGAPGAERPQRIVALAPSVVEILFALDLGERVVGVGDYARWPPEVEALPRLGGLIDADFEGILGLAPDLVVLTTSEADLAGDLERVGIDSLVVPQESIADVERAVEAVAERCAVAAAGRRLVADLRAGLAPRAGTDGAGAPPRVLLTVSREPGRLADVLAVGPDNFLDELLARLGAVNVLADSPVSYPQIGLEEILARSPEVIVELRSEQPKAAARARLDADWRAYPHIAAVASGRVVQLAGSHTLLPGPRLPLLYEQLAAAIGVEGWSDAGERSP